VTLSEDQAYGELRPHIRRLWNCMTTGYERYREYPDLALHRKATRANIVSDLIFANVISEFDEVPGARILNLEAQRIRLLSLSDSVTLWFKKLDENRESCNVSTKQSNEMNNGQMTLFPAGSLLVAGYELTPDETAVKCMSISPPNQVKPRWFIDVERVQQPTIMPVVESARRGIRLRITKGPEQIIL
jgi:hypothetical protein